MSTKAKTPKAPKLSLEEKAAKRIEKLEELKSTAKADIISKEANRLKRKIKKQTERLANLKAELATLEASK